MARTGKYTTDHDEIRRWVEERGGHPAHVKRRTRGKSDIGILRIDFPGYSGEGTLEEISWDDFFKAFDDNGLAFLHTDQTADGKVSRFSKLVARDTAQARREGVKTSRHHPARKRATARTARASSTRKSSSRKTSARPSARKTSGRTASSSSGTRKRSGGARSTQSQSKSSRSKSTRTHARSR
jgi:hypothetical protein